MTRISGVSGLEASRNDQKTTLRADKARIEKENQDKANFVSTAREHWKCVSCHEFCYPYRVPFVLKTCGDIICQKCYLELFHLDDEDPRVAASCPQCAARIAVLDVASLEDDAFAYNTLLNLPVPCPLTCSGWT